MFYLLRKKIVLRLLKLNKFAVARIKENRGVQGDAPVYSPFKKAGVSVLWFFPLWLMFGLAGVCLICTAPYTAL